MRERESVWVRERERERERETKNTTGEKKPTGCNDTEIPWLYYVRQGCMKRGGGTGIYTLQLEPPPP